MSSGETMKQEDRVRTVAVGINSDAAGYYETSHLREYVYILLI